MHIDLASWLRRTRPSYVIADERTWPVPAGKKPWESLASICGDAGEVQAYNADKALLGVWRRPTAGSNADLSLLRDVMQAQSTMLREVIATQTAVIRAIRESAETAARLRTPPVDSEEDGESEDPLDQAVAQALGKAMSGAVTSK